MRYDGWSYDDLCRACIGRNLPVYKGERKGEGDQKPHHELAAMLRADDDREIRRVKVKPRARRVWQ